ncbi:histidine phosphotransferase family protein [uncultured Thioclava sp.]|uniref:Histidine phosphotransferase family protein n=1 Tax=Thioclava arctica TaxID=3238301 RepID=A0ABV3TPG8_9RHOB|nr:histidine phosphotransferase family protein [uncultured Thioclava sp.]
MPFETAETSLNEMDLSALLGSRLCHDLISPLGAIGNGVELLAMSGQQRGPELDLIAQSVTAANARIKFFRVAFGQASSEQRLGRSEIAKLLGDLSGLGRISHHWQIAGDQARVDVKLAFLAVLCLETLLPFGGEIVAQDTPEGWEITAHSPKSRADLALWAALDEAGDAAGSITPAQVQFALLPREMARLGRRAKWEIYEDGGLIRL